MDETTNQKIERAVEACLQPEQPVAEQPVAEKAVVAEPQDYPIEGINLDPAFQAILDKLLPVRDRLLKSVSSGTARNFAEQRADLVQLQALVRAYDVLAGFVSPDGRMLTPMIEPDPEQAERRNKDIEENVAQSGQQMRSRAEKFSNVPLEPLRVERRGRTGFEPPVEQPNGNKPPRWWSSQRERASAS